MGKRGRIPKDKDKLVGHRDNSLNVIKGGVAFDAPKPNSRWLRRTKTQWQDYWGSDLAKTAQIVDFPAFYRLFQFYDEAERANRTIQSMGSAGLIDVGSKGQPVVNPLINLTLKLEDKILRLEQELGLTPLARQRLGIAYSEAQTGFAQLQKLLELDDQKEIEDPRLKVLENKEIKEKPEVKEKNG